MVNRKKIVVLGVLLTLVLTTQISVADAHTPGPMSLEYDISTDILTVTVTHVTTDVNTHYIYEIVVFKNSIQVGIMPYTNQSDSSGVTETFTILASDGDVLSATAKCSVSGQVTEEITISDSTTDTSTTTSGTLDPMLMSLLILTAIIAIGGVMIIVVIIKRR
jgi:hypothetical protein